MNTTLRKTLALVIAFELAACVTFYDTSVDWYEGDAADARSGGDTDDDVNAGDASSDSDAEDSGADPDDTGADTDAAGTDASDAADADTGELTCDSLNCPEIGRVCVDDGTEVSCGACLDGYVEDEEAPDECRPLETCDNLGCMEDNRECVPETETEDAFCDDCLDGFIEDEESEDPDAACITDPTFCEDVNDCAEPIEGAWSACAFDDECGEEGEQERLVTTFGCVDNTCVSEQDVEFQDCSRVLDEGTPCDGGEGICVENVCERPPEDAPDVSVTQVSGADHLRISWSPVDNATSYVVYRDTILLGEVTDVVYVDTDPQVVGGVTAPVLSASRGTSSAGVELAWTPAYEGTPFVHRYEVVALNDVGSGPRSSPEDGSLAPVEVASYEVQIEALPFADVGRVNSYLDNTAPEGTLSAGEVVAEEGTMSGVSLSLVGAGGEDGAPVEYTVRGVSAEGPAGPESAPATGWRAGGAGGLTVTWEGSASRIRDAFSTLTGLRGESVTYSSAPEAGEVRWYRAVVQAGTQTVRTEPVRGATRAPPVPPFIEGVVTTIGPGASDLGSPPDELGRGTGESWREIDMTTPFLLGVTEVTVADWLEVYSETPTLSDGCVGRDCPIDNITFESALAYCNDLSRSYGGAYPAFSNPCYELTGCTGQASNGTLSCTSIGLVGAYSSVSECQGIRLPTDAEWESAFRLGERAAFYNGEISVLGMTRVDPVLDAIGWYGANSGGAIQPVGRLEPTFFGSFDMAGNVAEFVWDGAAGLDALSTVDPEGVPSASGQTVRNCSAYDPAENCRAGYRTTVPHGVVAPRVGFRIAGNVPGPPGGSGPP